MISLETYVNSKSNHSFYSPYDKAKKGDVVFIERKHKEPISSLQIKLNKTKATYIIVPKAIKLFAKKEYQVLVTSKDPKAYFIGLIHRTKNPDFKCNTIDPKAVIDKATKIGKNCSIGAGVVILGKVKIGDNCVIMSNTVIGSDGFGHIKDDENNQHVFPHIGSVIIGKNVRIGANVCIDRGTLGNTIIKNGARIDNLVHIAHNVEIGKNSMVVANCMIAGSVKIKDNVWVGPSTSVLNQLTIEKDAYIGMAACVVKDIPKGKLAYGHPAKVK